MNIGLVGKRALVTGAGKGIGRAICKKLIDCGAETFALSRTKGDLESLQFVEPRMHTIYLDVTDWHKAREEVHKIGPLDLLVNNAGILTQPCQFLDTPREELEGLLDVNFKSAYNISQVVAKGMIEKGSGGAIVNISSAGGKKPTVQFPAYCCSKAALDMLTKCMAVELGRHNIRVNSVNPTVIWTAMTRRIHHYLGRKEQSWIKRIPLGRFVDIDDVVDTVVFLLSDKSGMITGECINIDGGLLVN